VEQGVVGRSDDYAADAQARSEPGGGRGDGNGPGGESALTATELRVVELVACGLNDRAIASLLSLSPTAVQANLRRVYCKLGITTRAALAADRPRVS
jgi:DNA-binding NarL/FixJ family response regulator